MSEQISQVIRYVEPAEANRLGADEFDDRERRILEEVNRRIAAAESVERLIDFLFETTRDVCPCDRIALAFVTEDRRRVIAHYARAAYQPLLLHKGYAEDLQHSSLAEVIRTGRTRIISDLAAYARLHPDSRSTRLLLREGVTSSMTCPLAVEGRNVGLLFRSSRRPDAYGLHQVRMHRAVAERLGQAVEKAYRIEQLAEANRAYDEMLGFVSHELKSPVASIIMDAEVLSGGYLGELSDPQQEKLRAMVRKGRYLLSLVKEYLDLARIEGGDLQLTPREADLVDDVIAPAGDVVAAQVAEKSIDLTLDVPPAGLPATCDPDLLQVVVVNLLTNAVKYGREGGVVRCKARSDDDGVEVSVWNEGPGFSPDERHKLFKKFSRLSDPALRKSKGTGVGLYTSWRIVNLHGGRIDARSRQGEWAEFSFRIPQPPGGN